MFARQLTLHLKPNAKEDLSKAIQTQIIPTLRKQKGFQDELVFVGQSPTEVFAISLWDRRENADAYGRTSFPEIQKTLANFLEGMPQVHTYEVLASTLPNRPVA